MADEQIDRYQHLSGAMTEHSGETRHFSNTQQWAEKYFKFTKLSAGYLPSNWKARIGAPEPPRDSSKRTRAELDFLIQLQAKRTEKDEQRIKAAITLDGFRFGDYIYPVFTKAEERPAMAALAKVVNHDISVVMFQTKHHFDRVRPSILDKRIQPAIVVPPHPAYPSGHATQAFAWAYLLVEMTPENKHKAILAGALEIAQDRELAGVHYPSDTALGQKIARQIVDMWLENPKFLDFLNKARLEWALFN